MTSIDIFFPSLLHYIRFLIFFYHEFDFAQPVFRFFASFTSLLRGLLFLVAFQNWFARISTRIPFSDFVPFFRERVLNDRIALQHGGKRVVFFIAVIAVVAIAVEIVVDTAAVAAVA